MRHLDPTLSTPHLRRRPVPSHRREGSSPDCNDPLSPCPGVEGQVGGKDEEGGVGESSSVYESTGLRIDK